MGDGQNIPSSWEMARTSPLHGRWPEHPLFMGDGQNIPSSWEMARTSPLHGRWPEHFLFMGDGQNISSSWEMARTPLMENAQSETFKGPCCCFENAPNTALTIVWTINVSIDCKNNKYLISIKRKIYLIVNQDNKLLGLCFVLK